MSTWYEMGVEKASKSWRAIRTLRAEPSGSLNEVLNKSKPRRREFHMALEQAQQQFNAAGMLGYESRPLNLFYGLTQAGRALAAGSKKLGHGENSVWSAHGHGLHTETRLPTDFMEMEIESRPNNKDMFSRTSIAIGSPPSFGKEKFGVLLAQLYDYAIEFSEPDGYQRPIQAEPLSQYGNFPLQTQVALPVLEAPVDVTSPAAIRDALQHYPALRGLEIPLQIDGSGKALHSGSSGRCILTVREESGADAPFGAGVLYVKGVSDYRGQPVYLPLVGKASEPLRPLMAWWTVLYALSMVARYCPSDWTKIISLQDNRIASRIEFILDVALDAVPDLVRREMDRLVLP